MTVSIEETAPLGQGERSPDRQGQLLGIAPTLKQCTL